MSDNPESEDPQTEVPAVETEAAPIEAQPETQPAEVKTEAVAVEDTPATQGRGWHGDPEGHARAGRRSHDDVRSPEREAEARPRSRYAEDEDDYQDWVAYGQRRGYHQRFAHERDQRRREPERRPDVYRNGNGHDGDHRRERRDYDERH